MNSQLIVHHPYRTLDQVQKAFSMPAKDVSMAWSIVNDHYMTDLPFLFPPHVIAVTAVFLATTLEPQPASLQTVQNAAAMLSGTNSLPKDDLGSSQNPLQKRIHQLVSWLAESEISISDVVECSQEIISFYDVWEQYSEKTCKEQIVRFVKSQGLNK